MLGRTNRFIPACAGNRQSRVLEVRESPVHPRVCGEQKGEFYPCKPDIGSSPRVRGTDPEQRDRAGDHRFIPACAGNSRTATSLSPRGAVHPRVCGEQASVSGRNPDMVGSSPRVRGTGVRVLAGGVLRRFIPACAGNSSGIRQRVSVGSVHPRVCGEQCQRERTQSRHRRFIPACAGNRLAPLLSR